MASPSADYGYYRAQYSNKNTTFAVAAADSATKENVVAAKSAGHTLYIQRILLSVFTDAAQSLTFQDDANTPVVIGKSLASPGLGTEIVLDFGPEGYALTEGKNLDIVISGAGVACKGHIEAYEKLTASNLSYLAGASLQ
jgi:hypothetical protein